MSQSMREGLIINGQLEMHPFDAVTNTMPTKKLFDLPYALKSLTQPTKIEIFAQNITAKSDGGILKGAHSGQIGSLEIAPFAFGSLLGHSEVRRLGESDIGVRNKLLHMINLGQVPLVCLGEEYDERYEGDAENSAKAIDFITKQVQTIYGGLSKKIIQGAVIAYEPIWAIGTGKNASPEQVEQVHRAIRKTFTEMYGKKVAKTIRILYGGSVTPENAEEIFAEPNVDGFLVGSMSANEQKFYEIGQIMLKQSKNVAAGKKGRLPILMGNLKTFRREYEEDLGQFYESLKDLDRSKIQIILAPPYTHLQEFAKRFSN